MRPTQAPSNSVARQSRLGAALTALSDNVDLGRRDVQALPSITPQLQYTHQGGLCGLAMAPTPGDQRLGPHRNAGCAGCDGWLTPSLEGCCNAPAG